MEYIDAKTIVTNNKGQNRDYLAAEYTMNIYHGCSHGCIYCFARSDYYHIQEFDCVKAKKDALRIIRDDLRRKVKPGIVITGGMSDPYNPLEKELKLTGNALELLNAFSFGICILTKSDLVIRDTDVLKDIREHSPVNVSFTITCADDEMCSKIEPNVAKSSQRFKAVEHLARNGIITGVLMDPVLPYLTDTMENIREMVKKAKYYGAGYIYASMGVTMEGIQREYFYQQAEKIMPGISEKYKKRFKEYYRCRPPRQKKLWDAFAEECEKQNIIYNMRAVNQKIRSGYDISVLSIRDI